MNSANRQINDNYPPSDTHFVHQNMSAEELEVQQLEQKLEMEVPNLFELNLGKLPESSDYLVDEARGHLLRAVNYLSLDERADVMRACIFGDIVHIKDKRKSGEPYITHPIAVAEILAGFRLDRDTLCAAVLHDTVEDTTVTLPMITKFFNANVANLVDGVTKLKSSAMSKQESQAATFHKILSATVANPRVLVIKLADRLHNMSTMDAVRPDKQKSTAKETLRFYVPLARIMGLNDLTNYIELLCYRNLNPEMYTKFSDKLLQHGLGRQLQKSTTQSYLQEVLAELKLRGVVELMDNRVAMYRQFFKNRGDMHSLIRHYEFEVVLENIEACNQLAFFLINTHQIGDDGIFDHIRKPLPGGNQSLTLIYEEDYNRIQVVIMTRRMKEAARLGVLGHDNDLSHSVVQASLRNMQDLLGGDDNLDTVMVVNDLIDYLNERKIVCYSPQGRAYELPRGATALDFAYAVGPSIGNIAVGANINHRHGKLGQVLAEGDTVAIETDPNAAPQANWLGFVATNKARREILKGLRRLPEDQKIQHGKDALERSLNTYDKSMKDLSESDWADILVWRGVNSQEALFLQIVDGTLLPQLVVSRLFSDEVESSDEVAVTRTKHLIAGLRGVELDFAACCNPIYGDPIVGHLSRHGLMIHRHKCQSLVNVRKENPYQVIHLDWKSMQDDKYHEHALRFSVALHISALLNEEQISQVIYELKALNIGVESTKVKEEHGTSGKKGTILRLVVRSRKQLGEAIEKLRSLLGYPNIMRLYHLG